MFTDQIAVITGGSSGLGEALARRLYEKGAHLALIARSMDKLETVRTKLKKTANLQRNVDVFSCDVADEHAVESTIKEICASTGEPDILINNAGILRENRFDNQPADVFRQTMDTNFYGAVNCTRAILPIFLKKKTGRIINISSMAGLVGVYGYAAYCSSKHALAGFTASLRSELKQKNVKMQIAFPPEFDSPMVDDLNTYRSEENRTVVQTIPVMTLDKVADEIIRGVEKNRYEIIPGVPSRVIAKAARWFPSISQTITDMQIKKAGKTSKP